jgi:8-oxo-dGTP pyrophosphatase MutT (NUDIX family)
LVSAGSILLDKATVDVAVRELFEETSLTPLAGGLTLLSGNCLVVIVRVPLHAY